MKKLFALAVALCMAITILPSGAMAIEQGDARVTIGADLDEQQRAQVYADFGIKSFPFSSTK